MRRLRQSEALSELGPVLARALAIAAVLVVTAIALVIVTRPYGDYEINAVFDDTRGLIEGGDVTAGFQEVGTVERIELGDDGLPRVRMRIDGDFRLHQGAFADIRLSSNVGAINRVVELSQGDTNADELEDGDTLGPNQTDQPVDLDAATATLDPETREDAAQLLAGLDAATKGRGDDLDRTLRHSSRALNETANALAQVTADSGSLRSLVSDTNTVVTALAQSPDDLGAAAERTAALLRITGARQAELRRTVEAIGPALDSGRLALENLDRAVPELHGLVVEARPLVDRLRPVAKRLPAVIKQLRPTITDASKLVREGRTRIKALHPLLTDAIPLVGELDPLSEQLNPVLDYLRVAQPELTGFFQISADLLANYDVNGHMTRFSAFFIPFAKHPNAIPPTSTAAGSLVRPFNRIPGVLEGEPWNEFDQSFIGGAKGFDP